MGFHFPQQLVFKVKLLTIYNLLDPDNSIDVKDKFLIIMDLLKSVKLTLNFYLQFVVKELQNFP